MANSILGIICDRSKEGTVLTQWRLDAYPISVIMHHQSDSWDLWRPFALKENTLIPSPALDHINEQRASTTFHLFK